MIQTFDLFPGITLRCIRDDRFKQGCFSLQFIRPMCAEEAGLNALIPAVLLRGTKSHPNLRSITLQLDDLYGASVSALVRRIGDYQTTGVYCGFMEDRFALQGDAILSPMLDFLRELLLEPIVENGGFCKEFVESEKRNLIWTIESELNDKGAYAAGQLLRNMCKADSFGIPRLGDKKQVAGISPDRAYAHYQKILKESAIALFYVGSARPEDVAELTRSIFQNIPRNYQTLPEQTPFRNQGGVHKTEEMDISQAKLCLGYITPITNRQESYAAMQVLNTVFGAGMTSKLFMNLREKMSLCYSIGSGYYSSKGIVTVSAGIDTEKEQIARQEIGHQLEQCRLGHITDLELNSAKVAILSSLKAVHDSPGAMENYYSTSYLSGFPMDMEQYRRAIEAITVTQVAAAAQKMTLHSSFLLKEVGP